MATNKKYAKNENGKLKYASNPMYVDGKMIVNPTPEVYLQYDFKEVIDVRPPDKDGFITVMDGFTESETQITIQYRYDEDPNPQPKPIREFSKLYLKVGLMKAGAWEMALEWMKSNNVDMGDGLQLNFYEMFETATTLSDDFPGFGNIVAALKAYLELDGEEIEEILSNAEIK